MKNASIYGELRLAMQYAPALFYFGWDDIRQQYKRTFLGPIWLTFGTCLWIFGMALVLSALFNSPISDFLPHTIMGMFIFMFLSLSITDGCNTFVNAASLIQSMRLPLLFHVLRSLTRYSLLYAHYLAVGVLLMTLVGHPPSPFSILAIPGIIIHLVLAFGIILSMGFVNARYRDLLPIATVVCQLMPLMTPIAWKRDMLKQHTWIADFNPFYHLIEIVRAPMMGATPSLVSYVVSLAVMILMLLFGLWRFRTSRYKLIFWI